MDSEVICKLNSSKIEVQYIEMVVNFNEEKQNKKVQELHEKEAEQLTQILSHRYGLPYINLNQQAIEVDALRLIPEERAREAGMAVYQATGKNLYIAILTTNNNSAK